MGLTKKCATCGEVFGKPPTCGIPEWNAKRRFCSKRCAYDATIGKPGHRLGKGGGPGSMGGRFLLCRVCGEPTKYHYSKNSPISGLVNCGRQKCRTESKRIRYARLSRTRKLKSAAGTWKVVRDNWRRATCPEEDLIAPWLISLGFERELSFTTHRSEHPRWFRLDFACQDRRICIEIDGTSHRNRRDKDARKDRILKERGWQVLRIPAASVRDDIEAVKSYINRTIIMPQ